jgi:hypothetical protein
VEAVGGRRVFARVATSEPVALLLSSYGPAAACPAISILSLIVGRLSGLHLATFLLSSRKIKNHCIPQSHYVDKVIAKRVEFSS